MPTRAVINANEAEAALDLVLDPVLICDTLGVVLWANASARVFFSAQHHNVVGVNVGITLRNVKSEVTGLRKDGSFGVAEVYVDDVTWSGNESLLVCLRDVTDQHEMSRQARIDSLTGIQNRGAFTSWFDETLATSAMRTSILTLFFIDVDNFKDVNDTFGHSVGDSLLRHVATSLRTAVRSGDTVFRVGGDEFAIVYGGGDTSDASTIAHRILEKLNKPISMHGAVITPRVSIGMFCGPTRALSVEDILRAADLAMYEAKREGGGRAVKYTPQLGNAALARQKSHETAVDNLANGLIEMHYQPIVNSRGILVGAEALMRIREGDSVVSAWNMIQSAEQSGFIVSLGRWALDTVCQQISQWHSTTPHGFLTSVNVSAREMSETDFATKTLETLNRHRIDPQSICIEITETSVMSNPSSVAKKLTYLHDAGISISIDDFGTGYSTLTYLREMPVDTIKIDRSFVSDVDSSAKDRAIVESQINLAHALGISVVAEGVETKQQNDILRTLGCDMYQGYGYGRPKSADVLTGIIERVGHHGAWTID
jgi:diguanylate cyclase (GGDEF)-like protein